MTFEERNIEISKLKGEINKAATLKECLLNDGDCSANIINAHSLQRMGALSRIEALVKGNNAVYALTETQLNTQTGELELGAIGKLKASTFFGFCGNHDSLLFQPIEQNPEALSTDSDEHCFLLSFRAFAISYHRKKEDINLLSTTDPTLRTKIRTVFGNHDLESQLLGAKIGLKDMEHYKTILTNALYAKDYSCLDYFAFEVEHTVPIAMSMTTTPPYLFSGKPINVSEDENYKYSDILTTVIPLQSRSIVLLAAFPDDPFGSEYLNELENMSNYKLQKALTWHVLTNSENCFFSPKWYSKLTPKSKRYLIELNKFSADISAPFLKYNQDKFRLDIFDKRHAI